MPVNIKNPAIKRIHADVRELMKDPSDQYHAAPMESNLFEWHFTIRGPPETEFEGGVYHGRILLPPEYPFRPPDIVFTTPNGRFCVGMKICLTISSYHPEHWQPAWGIRLILEALISFFPSPSHGALGGLDWTAEERKRLAAASKDWSCYKCGRARDLLPELRPKGEGGGGGGSGGYADQIKALHKLKAKTALEIAAESVPSSDVNNGADSSTNGSDSAAAPKDVTAEDTAISRTTSSAKVDGVGTDRGGGDDSDGAAPPAEGDTRETLPTPENASHTVVGAEGGGREAAGKEDDVLSFVAFAIVFAIIGILLRKVLRYMEMF